MAVYGCQRSKWDTNVFHMTATTATVAANVRADINRISTVSAVSRATGISETTLHRRLADGNFTASQLAAIANALRSDPADYFTN